MSVVTRDRRAEPAGGFPFYPVVGPRDQEALLVLSDGTVWRGRSVGSATTARGAVRVVGALAAVGEEGLLAGLDVSAFKKHLQGQDATVRGCITATGATYPLHAAVALAVARGEIGRP